MKRILIGMLIVFLAVQISYSEEAAGGVEGEFLKLERELKEMLEEDDSTMGMTEASKYEAAALEKLMDDYYRRLEESLDEEEGILLEIAHRKWLEYRDRELDFYRKYYDRGGSIWGLYYGERKNELVRKRVEQLASLTEEAEAEY